MVPKPVIQALRSTIHWSFSFYNFFVYLGTAIVTGLAFKVATEKDKNDFLIARDRLWNVKKSPIPGFQHYFYRLKDGFKFHYISNRAPSSGPRDSPLIILIHGFPDSVFMWKQLLQEPAFPLSQSTVVAVDLPGYGGTDSLKVFDTDVLEALTEFILDIRETYVNNHGDGKTSNVYIVGHDWGAVLSLRLAAEAPVVADRFVMVNGPHAQLAYANRDRRFQAIAEALRTFYSSPGQHWTHLLTAFNIFRPLLRQVLLFGYQYAFELPAPFVKILGTGANYSFIRGAAKAKYGKRDQAENHEQEEIACTLGPGVNEAKPPSHDDDETYGESVQERAKSAATAWYTMTSYYRDGCGWNDWSKKPETLARLRALDPKTPATTAEATQSTGGVKGAFQAPLTMLWGEDDLACTIPICLDGIENYLAPNKRSEVTLLPRSGHWSAVEKESRVVVAKLLALYAEGGDAAVPSVTDVVKQSYPGAVLKAKR